MTTPQAKTDFKNGKGAEGQNRTGDTMIFSHVLYQLSYLGTSRYSSRRRSALAHRPRVVY